MKKQTKKCEHVWMGLINVPEGLTIIPHCRLCGVKYEKVVSEAINREYARDRKREILCTKDEQELETQIYASSFTGTHPMIDNATKSRQVYLKKLQRKHLDPWQLGIRLIGVLVVGAILLALIY